MANLKRAYQFTCIPFGLLSAPGIFTKILYQVEGFLPTKEIRWVIYLHNNLILELDRAKLIQQTAITLSLFESLGFLVNYYPKSVLDPTNSEADPPRLHNQFNNKGAEPSTEFIVLEPNYSRAPEDFSSISCPCSFSGKCHGITSITSHPKNTTIACSYVSLLFSINKL